MADNLGAGLGGSGPFQKVWTLIDLDHNKKTFMGQFIAQDVTHNVGGRISEAISLNAQHPIIQWAHGQQETVTFRARLWANNNDETIDDRLNELIDLSRRHDDLKRPPLCTFHIGQISSLRFDCLVESVGAITYDEPRDDGSTRGAQLSITLKRFEEVNFAITDPSTPESHTRRRRARQGDTYESVAADEYGNAELGILLRQLNPRLPNMDLADLQPRDPVHIFPEEFLLTLPIAPEFHAFQTGVGNEAAEARRRDIFESRNGDSFTTVFADTSASEF